VVLNDCRAQPIHNVINPGSEFSHNCMGVETEAVVYSVTRGNGPQFQALPTCSTFYIHTRLRRARNIINC